MNLVAQDKNLLVAYIQLYLRENFGQSVRKTHADFSQTLRARVDQEPLPQYEITSDVSIEVTGYLTPQTYSSVALYMLQYYPNERYPVKWELTDDGWTADDSYYDNYTDNWRNVILTPDNWNDIANRIIGPNMQNYGTSNLSIEIPERVLSYLFGEVVSPLSSQEEVLRTKKLLLDYAYDSKSLGTFSNSLDYDEDLQHVICRIQQRFINKYPSPPSQFSGFKVTGYVDPWTEVIIERRLY